MLAFQNHKWPSAAAATTSIFGAAAPATIETADAASIYTLGTRFSTSVAGSVTVLRYYHVAKGTSGNDVRQMRLWGASTSTPLVTIDATCLRTFTGWVEATLLTPIALTIGTEYTVSYAKPSGEDYPADGTFSSAITDPTGVLTAPVGAGRYSEYWELNTKPYKEYGNSNYYADVAFQPA